MSGRLANRLRSLPGPIPARGIMHRRGHGAGARRARHALSGVDGPPARPGSDIGRQLGATDPRSCANLRYSGRRRDHAMSLPPSAPPIARRVSPFTGRTVMPTAILAQYRSWPACWLPEWTRLAWPTNIAGQAHALAAVPGAAVRAWGGESSIGSYCRNPA